MPNISDPGLQKDASPAVQVEGSFHNTMYEYILAVALFSLSAMIMIAPFLGEGGGVGYDVSVGSSADHISSVD